MSIKLQLGSFLKNHTPDTPENPFSTDGQPRPGKDFLEVAVPDELSQIRPTHPAAPQPSLEPTLMGPPPAFEPPPALTSPQPVPFEPPPELSVLKAVPFQPAPPIPLPEPVPFEPPPPLTTPNPVPFEPPPALTIPQPVPFEPAPPIPLSPPPADPYLGPIPPPTQPAASQPSQDPGTPAPLPPVTPPVIDKPGIHVRNFVEQPDPMPPLQREYFVPPPPPPAELKRDFAIVIPVPHEGIVTTEVQPFLPPVVVTEAELEARNLYTSDVKSSESPVFTLGSLFDSITDPGPTAKDNDILKNNEETFAPKVDLSRLFSPTPRTVSSDTPIEYRPIPGIAAVRGAGVEDPLRASAFVRGVIPAGFKGEVNGFYQTEVVEPSEPIDDDLAGVPLSFTDVRPYGNGKLRTVYFRPFITNISEDFSPDWKVTDGFGRTDPVKTYAGTTRTVHLGFIVYAFSPEDLSVIYQKLTWLISMVYPEYDRDLAYKAGPVCRLRIGDLISSTNTYGLAGTIDSLNADYSEQLWELKKGNKVPMGYRVTMDFTVLHDVPLGRGIDGKFGGLGSINGDTGLYQPPRLATARSVNTQQGPDVDNADDLRKFAGDINGYDPRR